MANKIIVLAEHLAAQQAIQAETVCDDGDRFLLDEGLDLIASYRSISDCAIRRRLRELIDAVARGELGLPVDLVASIEKSAAKDVRLPTFNKTSLPG